MSRNDIVLKQKICELIECNCEGEYWDFKALWDEKKPDDLVLDIINFANTCSNQECYIIFGVKDPKPGDKEATVLGIQEGDFRRTQDDINNLLADVPFAEERPSIKVRTIEYGTMERQSDVLIIENCLNTPIYLSRRYHNLKAGAIYARHGSVNTSIDGTADPKTTEKLWEKRFKLLDSPLKQYLELIASWDFKNVSINITHDGLYLNRQA